MTHVVPLDTLARRIPIVAKLKSGATKGNRPTALDKWRATTSSRPWAENFASRYGGEVKAFGNDRSPHQFEVFSDATEVAIALIEDGYSINYELWSAGGCQRRCNGVNATVLQTTGPDNVEYVDTPCICDRKGALECSLKSRLTFVLPDLPFAGGCVYETASKNFAEESQGMLQLIRDMQSRGVTRGVLRLEQRRSSGNRKYTIAVVGVTSSLEEIASGQSARSLGQASEERPALSSSSTGGEDGESVAPVADSPNTSDPEDGDHGEGSPFSGEEPHAPDAGGEDLRDRGATDPPPGEEDIVDAELVEEEPPLRLSKSDRAKRRAGFMATLNDLGLDYEDDVRPYLIGKHGGSWTELPDAKIVELTDALSASPGNRAKFRHAVEKWNEKELAS